MVMTYLIIFILYISTTQLTAGLIVSHQTVKFVARMKTVRTYNIEICVDYVQTCIYREYLESDCESPAVGGNFARSRFTVHKVCVCILCYVKIVNNISFFNFRQFSENNLHL